MRRRVCGAPRRRRESRSPRPARHAERSTMSTAVAADAPRPGASTPPASAPALQAPPAWPPLHGPQLVLGTIALSLATFMNVLDSSIANVSIPAIAGDMGVSPSQGTWVITSFAVANAISVPLTGWLTQRFGQVRLFTGSVLLFVVMSWLCGLAPNIESLIFLRVPLDTVGLGLLVLWVGALQVMIDKGKELDWFASTQIVVLAVIAVVGFLFFLAWELTDTHPVVDLRLFGQRNFALATLSLSMGYGLFFGNVVLMPLWLQQYMGYTATWAGMAMAPA